MSIAEILAQVQLLSPQDFSEFQEKLARITNKLPSRMNESVRYRGNISEIESVEKQVTENALCYIKKDTSNDVLFGVETMVKVRNYEVVLDRYIFRVLFRYDHRDGTAYIDIKDKDAWWLCKVSPQVLNMVSHLEHQNMQPSQRPQLREVRQ